MTEPSHAVVNRHYRLVRADDQLDLRVELVDLEPSTGAAGPVIAHPAGGFLIVRLAAQHLCESATTSPMPSGRPLPPGQNPDEKGKGQRPVFGDETVLVFEVPQQLPTTPPIPFTVEGVLAALPQFRLVTDSDLGAVSPLPAPAPKAPAAAVVAHAAALRAADPAAAVSGRATTDPDGSAAPGSPAPDPLDPLADRARRTAARVGPTGPAPAADPDPDPDPDPGDRPAAPGAPTPAAAVLQRITELNFPFRLVLSPPGGATRFRHAATPLVHDGHVPLWHTALAHLRADGALVEVPAELFVLKTKELRDGGSAQWRQRVGDARLAGPLNALVRRNLVNQTFGVRRPNGTLDRGRPMTTDQLLLSPLGAWLDVEGEWSDNNPLRSYRHRLAMGRDLLVRTVVRGELFPLRHDAILTTTTRRVVPERNGEVGVLVTEQVVTVLDPTRAYHDGDAAGRGMPWGEVTLLTRSAVAASMPTFVGSSVLINDRDGQPLPFRCRGIDRGGRTTEFEMGLVFVPDGTGPGTSADLASVATAYNGPKGAGLRTVDLGGQVLAVAPPSAEAPEATDVVAQKVTLVTQVERDGSSTRVTLTSATIEGALPALERFAPGTGTQVLKYAKPYLDSAFSATGNAGQILLEIDKVAATAPPTVDLGNPQVTGGMVAPKFPLTGLSRRAGPVGGPIAALASGKVKASEVLGAFLGDVKLFGVFPLADLLGTLALDVGTDVPQMVTHTLDGVSVPSLRWSVPLFRGGSTPVVAKPPQTDVGPFHGTIGPVAGRESRLEIDATTELAQPVNPLAPVMRSHTSCRIQNVALTLGLADQDLVVLPLQHISFTSENGSKPDLDAKVGRMEFKGVLGFLSTLAQFLPEDAFSDPPALEVTPDGVRSSLSIPVPPVATGMFLLENITFTAALDLWFARPPELSLSFSTPDNRFRVAVLCFAGGGYLGVGLSTRGLERLDGMLEFGAAVAVNLGVARGSVSAMAGIAFSYDRDTGARLTGYLEVRGEVDVLGLIEVGVKLLVTLTYVFETEELVGEAKMEVSVKVLFWRKTVCIPFKYSFAGGDDAPRALAAPGPGVALPGFREQMAPANWPTGQSRPWDTYCDAFA